MFRTGFRISVAMAVLGAIAAAGCGENPAGPDPAAPPLFDAGIDAPGPREFYPLAAGNAWSYHRDHLLVVEVIVGPPYKRVETYEGVVDRRIEGNEEIEGVAYFIEATTLTPAGRPPTRTSRTYYRQDHAGLYASDLPVVAPTDAERNRPPRNGDDRPVIRRGLREHGRKLELIRAAIGAAGRPGGILSGEILLLGYPLRTGAVWYNRVEPFVVRSVVEGPENLDLPAGRFPAWRVRVENELLDPADRVVVWYGRSGRLATSIHTETLALDTETGETALITTDDRDVLTGLELGPRR